MRLFIGLLVVLASSCGGVGGRCVSDTECADELFCNGASRCAPDAPSADARGCVTTPVDCGPSLVCVESQRACMAPCKLDLDCQDNSFCNGPEYCRPEAPSADARGCVRLPPSCGAGCIEAVSVEVAPGRSIVTPGRCSPYPPGTTTVGGVVVLTCPPTDSDRDNDGHVATQCGGDDCDDANFNINPSKKEICDPIGVDEDCDPCTVGQPQIDDDRDRDGFPSLRCTNILPPGLSVRCTFWPDFPAVVPDVLPSGTNVMRGTDCNDLASNVNPTISESCNGVDDDCDEVVDEGVTQDFYEDLDHDGFGAGLALPLCASSDDFSSFSNDCDDSNPAIVPGSQVCGESPTNAGAVRLCTSAGTWAMASCEGQRACVPQANGTGVCF